MAAADWALQRACEIQPASNAPPGHGAIPVSAALARQCTRDSLQCNPRFGAGRDAFDALRRLVEFRGMSCQP